MKKKRGNFRIVVCLIAVLLMTGGAGCTVPATRVELKTEKSPSSPESDYESPFYYFSMAQFEIINNELEMAMEHLAKAIWLDPDSIYLKKELATLYLHLDKSEKAFGIVEDILVLQPDDVETLKIYGKMLQIAGKNEEAKKIYTKIINLDSRQKQIYLLLGGLFLDDRDFDNAETVYSTLRRQFPDFFLAHFYLGKVYAAKNRFFDAERELLKTIELNPDIIEPRFDLINLYQSAPEKMDTTSQISSIYQDILEMDPENIQAKLALALFYEQNNMSDKAEFIFSSLAEESLSNDMLLRKMIQLYIEPKKYQEAGILLENILQYTMEDTTGDVSELHYIAGIAFCETKQLEKAIDHLEQVSRESVFYQKAALHIAYLHIEQNRMPDAMAHLENVIQNIPEAAEIIFYLGVLYEESNDYKKAETLFQRGLALKPDDTEYLFRLGVIYDKQGNKLDAIEKMKEVIKLEPDHFNALNYLGYTYAEMNIHLEEAESLIRKALKYKPDDAYITDSLGWVYFQKGEYRKALFYLEKAVQMAKTPDAVLLEHLGDVYLKLNRKQDALKTYQRALKLDKTGRISEIEKKIRQIQQLISE
jgi:tetratricopeptide (TPR) repeat protein